MKKLLPTAALVLAATLAAPAHAQFAKAEDAIQYRQGAFRVLGHHFGRLGAMAAWQDALQRRHRRSRRRRDCRRRQAAGDRLRAGFETGHDTRALPALWKELPKVKELSDKMVAETGKLAVAAKSGNLDQLKAAFGPAADVQGVP